jgi:hypothetical protein
MSIMTTIMITMIMTTITTTKRRDITNKRPPFGAAFFMVYSIEPNAT